MPATDIERLVVQLSADVRGYQKSLDRARNATNRTAGDIERRFNRMNKSISTAGVGLKSFAGGFLGGLSAEALVRGVGNLVKSMGDLNDEAAKVGTRASSLEALASVAANDSVEMEQLTASLAKLNLEVGKARATGKGKLFDLFTANQKQFSDDIIENFLTLSELVRNAPTSDAQQLVASFGLGGKQAANFIAFMKKGAAEIRAAMKEIFPTEELAQRFDEASAKADEFDKVWTDAWNNFSRNSKQATVEGLAALEAFLRKNKRFAEALEKIAGSTPAGGATTQGTLKELEAIRKVLVNLGFIDPEEIDKAETEIKQVRAQIIALQADKERLKNTPFVDPKAIEAVETAIVKLIDQLILLQNKLADIQRLGGSLGITLGKAFGTSALTGIKGGPSPGLSAPGVARPTIVPGEISTLIGLIQKVESNNNANAINFKDVLGLQRRNLQLESMTIAQWDVIQTQMLRAQERAGTTPGKASSAIGRFQLTRDTIRDFAPKLGMTGATLLNEENQKKIVAAVIADAMSKEDPVAALKGRFEGLKGLSDETILAAARANTEEIGKANVALQEQQELVKKVVTNIKDSTAAQELETKLMQTTTGEREKQLKIAEALKALEDAHVTITPQIRADVEAAADAAGRAAENHQNVVDLMQLEEDAADRVAEANERAAQTAQAVANAFGSAFQGFISDLAHGKKLTDALRDSLLKLGESLLNIALDNLLGGGAGGGGGLLGGLFGGGGGGGLLGGLFHGGGVAGQGGHGRRVPALAFAGAPRYHGGGFAGLQQGEVPAILKRGEIIFPNMDAVRNAVSRQGNGAGGGIVQNNTFVSPSWKAAERSQNQIARTAGASLDRVRRTL